MFCKKANKALQHVPLRSTGQFSALLFGICYANCSPKTNTLNCRRTER